MKRLYQIIIAILVLSAGAPAYAQVSSTALATEIQKQIVANKAALRYPQSVGRFYKGRNFQSKWIKPQNETGPTWQAMLLLDCVMTFGLSHDDYHPKQLTYTLLHHILDTPGKASLKTQAVFEITLTDALLTLINHLHYGKLNPAFTQSRIDAGKGLKFNADSYLANITAEKDLVTAIAGVQPKNKWYTSLQGRMQLLKGKYQGDCYEVPEAEVRKIAINLERLRWADITGDRFILVNIPSATVTWQQPDTTYQFKLIAGKPMPGLRTTAGYFTIGNDAVMLGLTNNPNTNLQNTPEQANIKHIGRNTTTQYIRVKNTSKLVQLLLTNNGAILPTGDIAETTYPKKVYRLKTPVPVYVTYITCAVDEWGAVNYKDIYGQDKALEAALYNMHRR